MQRRTIRLTTSLLLPALAFSYLGSGSLLRVGGNFYPELALFPWLMFYLLRPSTAVAKFTHWFLFASQSGIFALLLIMLLSLLGGLQPEPNIFGIYANARALLVAVVAFQAGTYAVRTGQIDRYCDVLVILCFLATGMSVFQQLVLADGGVKSPIPIAAPIIALVLSASRERFGLALLAFALIVLAAVTGFFRQYVILAAFSGVYLAVCLFPLVVQRGRLVLSSKRLLWLSISSVAAVVVVSTAAPATFSFLQSSETRYIQSIAKWNDLWLLVDRGVSVGSEAMRANTLGFFFGHLDQFSIPNGFLDDDRSLVGSILGGEPYYAYGVSPTRDSIAVYLIVTVGSFAAGLFLLWLFYRILRHLAAVQSLAQLSTLALVAATFFVFFWLDGTAVIQVEKAFFTGTLVAMLRFSTLTRRSPVEVGPSSRAVAALGNGDIPALERA